jgi:hypothetical protein
MRTLSALAIRAAAGACLIASHGGAQPTAPQLATLYSFTGGSDGSAPNGLIPGAHGVFYGTAHSGGSCLIEATGCGTVFSLTPPTASGGTWTLEVLYTFTGASDGGGPGGLLVGKVGALYGPTAFGGTSNYGVVYKLVPPPAGSGPMATRAWIESVLYNRDDEQFTPLIIGDGGALYGFEGTTLDTNGYFVELAPPAIPGGAWTETVLYSFTSASGRYPSSLIGTPSALFGSAFYSGTANCTEPEGCGTVFQVTPPQTAGASWTEAVLYDFSFTGRHGYTGGYEPIDVIFGQDGVFYGVTLHGGTDGESCYAGCGVVFQLAPPATPGNPWNETVIYTLWVEARAGRCRTS